MILCDDVSAAWLVTGPTMPAITVDKTLLFMMMTIPWYDDNDCDRMLDRGKP